MKKINVQLALKTHFFRALPKPGFQVVLSDPSLSRMVTKIKSHSQYNLEKYRTTYKVLLPVSYTHLTLPTILIV